MKSHIVKIGKDGKFTIPKEIREKLNIKPGQIVTFKNRKNHIEMSFK